MVIPKYRYTELSVNLFPMPDLPYKKSKRVCRNSDIPSIHQQL